MPIDEAMTYEIAGEWFPPFLAVEMMTPSHPLRESALRAAEQSVYDSYQDTATATAEGGSLDGQFQEIADDVVKVLRGVAWWVAENHEVGSHDCENCQTCGIHDGRHDKCCGCYDGVCCMDVENRRQS